MDDMEEFGPQPETPKRKANGTFAPGSSGNPDGRPRKEKMSHSIPHHNHRAAIAVAETIVPVKRADGSIEEITVYEGVLRKLAEKAAGGHQPSINAFLKQMEHATAANVHQVGLLQEMLAVIKEQQNELDLVRRHFPKFNGGGVVNLLPDGSRIPGGWMEAIRKLDELDAREKALQAREKTIQVRESAFELNRLAKESGPSAE